MRQAGRSLPEYRALREKHGFFEIAGTPELCAEVTLQPVRRHGVDAAVLFADIMSPVLGMGVDVELVEGVGPVVEEPIDSAADVEQLRVVEPEEWAAPILEAVRLVRGELEPERALVGFCGGPFTVAGYLVEGKPSRDFVAHEDAHVPGARDLARADGAADGAVRALRRRDRRRPAPTRSSSSTRGSASSPWRTIVEFVAPYSARVLDAADVPTIHFGTGATTQLLAEMAAAGGSAIGVDWRIRLDDAWTAVGGRASDPGEPRAGGAARSVGAGRSGRRSTSCGGRAAGRATSSTSGTASCRRPIPTC